MKKLLTGLVGLLCGAGAGAQYSISAIPSTSVQGFVCLGSVNSPEAILSADATDYVLYSAPLGVGCTYAMQVPLAATVPAGQKSGFRVWSGNLATVLNNVVVKTYLGNSIQQTISGNSLLNVRNGGYNDLYFYNSAPYNKVTLELGSIASVLQQMRVFNFTVEGLTSLPVYFTDLSVQAVGGRRHLSWEQYADEPLSFIRVEKSTDRSRFEPVQEAGTASGRVSWTDHSAAPRAWYRLHGKTSAGKEYFSAVVESRLQDAPLRIRPNTAGELVIESAGLEGRNGLLRLFTPDGSLAVSSPLRLQARNTLPLPGLPAGTYLATLTVDGTTYKSMLSR
ncbi:MAG: hypothetical protein EOO16_08675 [Chitinophagaceae bacterium]|nr:MAG: hypothetical protein EOO16_08675 [Chitinophagaceae bacterium]